MSLKDGIGGSLFVKIAYIVVGLLLGFDWKAVLVLDLKK